MKLRKIFSWWGLAALLLVAAIIAGVVVIVIKNGHDNAVEITLAPEKQITGQIYVGGAVNNPGWYPLFSDDTLNDVIRAAGGIQDGADLSQIQLSVGADNVTSQKIDINRAEAWLLEALPGVGEAKAKAIIAYRQEHGFFHDTDEVLNVPGFSQGMLDKIEDLITVKE